MMTKLVCFVVVVLLAISATDSDVNVKQQYVHDASLPNRNLHQEEFDWTLLKNVLSRATQNTILSPFLVKFLLSILVEAAGETTRTHRELQSILPSVQSTAETRKLYGKAFRLMLQKKSGYKFHSGSKLFLHQSILPSERLKLIIQTFYNSDVEAIDFDGPNGAADLINAWCANVTDNHLTNIISQEDAFNSNILLLNAIYYEGVWQHPFPETQTTIMDFSINQNEVIIFPFITQAASYFYTETVRLNSKILRLPYEGGKYAMYIVLPQKVDGLEQLLKKINRSTWYRARKLMEEVHVKVSLPKIKFSNSISLKETLKDMGIRRIFTSDASFPLMTRGISYQGRLQVSNVLQKAGIEINERGSTAFTSTDINTTDKFDSDFEFIADRPFLFLIEDESTGALIFSGKVLRPKY